MNNAMDERRVERIQEQQEERERDGEKRDVFCCYFIIRDGSPCRAASACIYIHGMII